MNDSKWRMIGILIGLILAGVAIWLMYTHDYPKNVAVMMVLGFGMGPCAILWGILCSDDHLTVTMRRDLVEKLGPMMARVLHVLIGLVLVGLAAWALYDHMHSGQGRQG